MIGWLKSIFSDPAPEPFNKTIYLSRLVIKSMSADEPTGQATRFEITVSGKKIDGKIWLDKDVAWHELQHLCAIEDPDFAHPDGNIIG